jgi:hypothetical protein
VRYAAFASGVIQAVFGLDSEFKKDRQPTGNYQ